MFDDEALNYVVVNDEYIIGCDEVGTGTAAGPLVVCGVRAEKEWRIDGLRDSKKLSEKKRNIMRDKLSKESDSNNITIHIAERSNECIDKLGLAAALKEAYVEVFKKLFINKSFIVVDGNMKFENILPNCKIMSIIKADDKVPSVMAASIIAKTYRDALMKAYHENYNQYGWDTNVGYLTGEHLNAIGKHGMTPLHRKSFKIKSYNF